MLLPPHPCASVAAARRRESGYTVREYQRSRGTGEVLVDDKLHAQMLQAVADPVRFPRPQTMVLASGDGNDNRGAGSTNFVRVGSGGKPADEASPAPLPSSRDLGSAAATSLGAAESRHPLTARLSSTPRCRASSALSSLCRTAGALSCGAGATASTSGTTACARTTRDRCPSTFSTITSIR